MAGAIDGVNEAGLCITYNYAFTLRQARRTRRLDFDGHFRSPGRSRTVTEAVDWISSRPRSSGALLMLADTTGDIASLELSASHSQLRRPNNRRRCDLPHELFFQRRNVHRRSSSPSHFQRSRPRADPWPPRFAIGQLSPRPFIAIAEPSPVAEPRPIKKNPQRSRPLGPPQRRHPLHARHVLDHHRLPTMVPPRAKSPRGLRPNLPGKIHGTAPELILRSAVPHRRKFYPSTRAVSRPKCFAPKIQTTPLRKIASDTAPKPAFIFPPVKSLIQPISGGEITSPSA